MEKLKIKYENAARSLETLRQILEEPFSIIVRDATIQRFEYPFEAVWKYLRSYLREKEGIICNSPKSCFREAFSLGVLNEEETVQFLEMTDNRNLIYKEEIARNLYNKIAKHYKLMQELLKRISSKKIKFYLTRWCNLC